MWAMRIVHEACLYEHSHGSCFVTFTYRSIDECTDKQFRDGHYVPKDYSLDYHHFKDFLKRLRRHFPQKIRYFHCGEYGDENLRPHYHACLFNVSFADQFVEQQTEGITTYSSATLSKLWPYGFCTIGELNFETASYTAGYILKKITGVLADDYYLRNDEDGVAHWVKPPYTTMSLKPGIGADFYEKYKTDFYDDTCPVPGRGIFQKIPRYYQSILAEQSPDRMDHIKHLRAVFMSAHGEDFTPARLMDKYKCARARASQRKRTL